MCGEDLVYSPVNKNKYHIELKQLRNEDIDHHAPTN